MASGRHWVGLVCVLSAALFSACDESKCPVERSCTANSGADGNGDGPPSNGGSSSSGAGGVGASPASAGHAGSGSAGSIPAGEEGGGGAIDAGEAGSAPVFGGAGGSSAGEGQGGAGGDPGSSSCTGAQVLFLIQRSGVLFEQPGIVNSGEVLPLEESYFGFLEAALVGDGSAAKPYEGKLPIGVSFLFASRDLQVSAAPAVCPQLSVTAPSQPFQAALAAAFTQGAADHTALVTAKQKVEAPVPESIASAVATWTGTAGARHLVLVTAGMPDTCTAFDGPCGLDATVKAVQAAKAAGVTTHVIGLGHDLTFNYTLTEPEAVTVQTGYEEYLQQLANAGSGEPLGPPNVEKLQDYACGSPTPAMLTATYSATPGDRDAKFYQVMTAADAKAAVGGVLAEICP